MNYNYYQNYFESWSVNKKINSIIDTIYELNKYIKDLRDNLAGIDTSDEEEIQNDLKKIDNFITQIDMGAYSAKDYFIEKASDFDQVYTYYKNLEGDCILAKTLNHYTLSSPLITEIPISIEEEMDNGYREQYIVDSVTINSSNEIEIKYTPKITYECLVEGNLSYETCLCKQQTCTVIL